MSKIELIILSVALLIPIVSLIIVAPKLKKGKEKDKPTTVTLQEFDKKENKEQKKQVKEDIPPVPPRLSSPYIGLSDEDFQAYLERKAASKLKPRRILSGDFDDFLTDNDDTFAVFNNHKKSIDKQFEELTPEMKAIILSNVFDRKY